MKNLRIGISGASGKLGKATLAELVRLGGHEIIGVSRSPEKVAAPAAGRLGDYDRPDTLATAYAGLDRLLLIPTGEMGPGRRAAQSVAAIDAAVAAGVGHIVLMSSAGILTSEGHAGAIYNATGPQSLTGAERAALVAEASGQPFSFLALDEAVLRQGMEQAGLPALVIGAILSIQEKFVQGGFDIVTGDVERLAGRKPRALQDLLVGAFPGR